MQSRADRNGKAFDLYVEEFEDKEMPAFSYMEAMDLA